MIIFDEKIKIEIEEILPTAIRCVLKSYKELFSSQSDSNKISNHKDAKIILTHLEVLLKLQEKFFYKKENCKNSQMDEIIAHALDNIKTHQEKTIHNPEQ